MIPFSCDHNKLSLSCAEITCENTVDLCIIMDSSSGIRAKNPDNGIFDNWELEKEFVSLLLNGLTIRPDATRVAIVIFSEEAFLAFGLNTYSNVDNLENAIKRISFVGKSSNIPEAFRVAREQCFSSENGDRPDARNVALFISDGIPLPSSRRDMALQEAEALKKAGVWVIAGGITDTIDVSFLQAVSSPPQEESQNYFLGVGFGTVQEIQYAVEAAACTDPLPPGM